MSEATKTYRDITAAALQAIPRWAGAADRHGQLTWGSQPQVAAWLGCSQATVSRVWAGTSAVQLVHLAAAAESRGQSLAQLVQDLERWHPGWEGAWEPCQDCRGRGRLDRILTPARDSVDEPRLVWESCLCCDGTGLEPRWTERAHLHNRRPYGDGCQGRTSYGPHVWGPSDLEGGWRRCRVCGEDDAGVHAGVHHGQAPPEDDDETYRAGLEAARLEVAAARAARPGRDSDSHQSGASDD